MKTTKTRAFVCELQRCRAYKECGNAGKCMSQHFSDYMSKAETVHSFCAVMGHKDAVAVLDKIDKKMVKAWIYWVADTSSITKLSSLAVVMRFWRQSYRLHTLKALPINIASEMTNVNHSSYFYRTLLKKNSIFKVKSVPNSSSLKSSKTSR